MFSYLHSWRERDWKGRGGQGKRHRWEKYLSSKCEKKEWKTKSIPYSEYSLCWTICFHVGIFHVNQINIKSAKWAFGLGKQLEQPTARLILITYLSLKVLLWGRRGDGNWCQMRKESPTFCFWNRPTCQAKDLKIRKVYCALVTMFLLPEYPYLPVIIPTGKSIMP